MPGEDAFQVEGRVLETLSDRTCRVVLSNGHTLVGFITRGTKGVSRTPLKGQKLILKLSPYDLSKGRIIGTQ